MLVHQIVYSEQVNSLSIFGFSQIAKHTAQVSFYLPLIVLDIEAKDVSVLRVIVACCSCMFNSPSSCLSVTFSYQYDNDNDNNDDDDDGNGNDLMMMMMMMIMI